MLFTVEEFGRVVRSGSLIDYDGIGTLLREGQKTGHFVYPSDFEEGNCRVMVNHKCHIVPFPAGITHVVWSNR